MHCSQVAHSHPRWLPLASPFSWPTALGCPRQPVPVPVVVAPLAPATHRPLSERIAVALIAQLDLGTKRVLESPAMAIPRCPKPNCDGANFSMSELTPSGSEYKYSAVCCSRCGAVVGVLDFFNLGSLLKKIQKKLGA